MTEKRFTIIYGVDENPFEWDILDNEKDALICQCNGKPICDLLNELHEENQALKSDRARYEEECRLDIFKELHDENEQLKQKNKLLYEDIDFLKRFIEKRGFKAKLESDKR